MSRRTGTGKAGTRGRVRLQIFWTPRIMTSGRLGKNSGTPASTTVWIEVFGTTSASLSANMSTMTRTFAPESLNWWIISDGV